MVRAESAGLVDERSLRPCVVMAHGFGCTRDGGLAPFAVRFAAAGCDVLLFDYRGFETSDGHPRQYVSHRRQRGDWRSAVAFARGMDNVDPERIALWGTPYAGGHVIAVAAGDQRAAAVIAQGAAVDGLAVLRKPERADPTASRSSKGFRMVVAAVRHRCRGRLPGADARRRTSWGVPAALSAAHAPRVGHDVTACFTLGGSGTNMLVLAA